MATDMWYVVEVRDTEGDNTWKENSYATEHKKVASEPRPYLGTRDFKFFSILAGIRSWPLPLMDISLWKIPEDAAPAFRQLYLKFDNDAYAPRTIMYPELKAYKWNEQATKYLSRRSFEPDLADKVRNILCKQYRSLLFHKLPKLAKQYGKDNVRMVLFFDN